MSHLLRRIAVVTAAAMLAIGLSAVGAVPAGASVGIPAPNQAGCEAGGSASPLWSDTTVTTRPQLTSVTVGGESIAVTRIENPLSGEIGVAICPQELNANNTGITFIRRTGSSYTTELAGAVTPNGLTVTASTPITFTATLGDLSPRYSFSTVFANVDAWSTTGLGTSSATLTATLRAADTVFVDGNIPAEQGCTQQPPNCTADVADADYLGASMQLKSESNNPAFTALAGGYFALRSAIGGYVAPSNGTVDVTVGAPHHKSDGTTLNVGSMTAFLPSATLQSWFGLTPEQVTSDSFAVTRNEGSSSSGAAWTSRVETGGIAIDVPNVTFSSPRYRIAGTGARATAPAAPSPKPTPTTAATSNPWPAPAFFSARARGRNLVAAFAGAPGARYQVVLTNLRRTFVIEVGPSSRWTARAVTRKLSRGNWLVVARLKVGAGYGSPAVGVVRI